MKNHKNILDEYIDHSEIAWGTPQLLPDSPMLPVMELPEHCVPARVLNYCRDVAKRMSIPIDFPVASALTFLSSAIGARALMKPKQYDNWLVTPNLWGFIVATPSSLKSPATKEVRSVFGKIETAYTEEYEAAMTSFKNEKQVVDVQRKSVSSKHGKVKSLNKDDFLAELNSIEEPEPPTQKRLMVNDVTSEKLASLLSENPHGLLVYRDELIGLLNSWSKSGRENERAFYLEGWNGNDSYNFNRVGSGETHIENLCISLFGHLVPDKLRSYFASTEKNDNDGAIQRFQLAVYPDPKPFKYVDAKPNLDFKAAFSKVAEYIVGEEFNDGEIDEKVSPTQFFRFSDEAQGVFKEWLEYITKKADEDDNDFIAEHLSKYRSLVPSLSLIFHVIELADMSKQFRTSEISVATLNDAIAFSDYLETHARRIYRYFGDTATLSALSLAARLKAKKLEDGFNARTIIQKNWKNLTSYKQINDAIEILLDLEWLRVADKEINLTGRTKSDCYDINPSIG
jgi:hypothetical protein